MIKYTKDYLSKDINQFGWKIGGYSYGCPTIIGKNEATLNIGKFCSISWGVRIFLGHEHRTDWVTTYPFSSLLLNNYWNSAREITGHPKTKGSVLIGNDVWLASQCTILSGVCIGDGAVVSTCSVVTKDIEPYTIVGGVPAKPIRKRFNQEIIKQLLEIQWWNWSKERIEKAMPLLLNPEPEKLIEWHYRELERSENDLKLFNKK